MLDQFGAADGGDQEFGPMCVGTLAVVHRASKLVFKNGPVDFAQLFGGGGIFDTDDNAIGMEEILHGRAFAQKFRIGSDAEAAVPAAVCGKRALQLDASAGRHRAFFDDEFGRTRLSGYLLCHVVDGGKIGAAVGARRSANTDEDRVTKANCFTGVDGIGNFSGFAGRNKNFIEMLLVDRHLAGFQLSNAACVDVRADHIVSRFSKTRARHQANVATADHR